MNERRIVSELGNPALAAAAERGTEVSSSSLRAVSSRTRSTYLAGVTPVSARNARAK